MNPVLRNILAVLAGALAGSFLNGIIIMISPFVISPPAGVNVSDMESLKANMHLFEPKHFLMPFLAHALGTLAGAFITAKIAASRQLAMAWIVGVLFLIAGIMNVMMLPAPMWFNALDLIGAYIPMAYIGAKLAMKN